ncbi:AraC family transcriptional regulator [Parapedobacter soli]|uniref:AraC family transcriptional regulator n=1 Tax=Parapedobacter soli TaxID=416955 RepID=UPI0021C8439C|nr:AraC family transcriptional regulator [Parapedobacter soli]
MEKIPDGFKGEKAIVLPYSVRDFQAENTLTENLYVTHIGYYPHAKSHFRDRVAGATEHIIIYCEEGLGWIQIDGDKFNLSKKQALIIPASTPHVYAADKQFPWSIYWIHFCGRHVERYASIMGRVLNTGAGPETNHDFRTGLFESIFQNLSNGYLQDNLEYSSVCLRHFLASFLYVPQFNRLSITGEQDIVNTSIAYMKSHLEDKLTLADIAGSVNYSPAYFGVLFKERTSFSPIEYYNQLKIQRACSLLQFTDLKIKEIAFKLGYYDAFHFSKAFAHEMEISPREYRVRYK